MLTHKTQHERGIVYRDIKPENILLMDKEDLTIKLMDFGLTKIIGEESFTTTLCGTPSYVAPEILADSRHRRYTRAVDIWSLGVVLYICLCGFPPFSDELYTKENPFTLADQIKARRFDYPSPYWDSVGDPALDLIDRMLTVDMEKRYTIDECLEHPWMQNKTASTSDTRSTSDSLVGGISSLNLSKRKVVRERTLLSSINDVKVTRVVEVGPLMDPVKVYVKDPNSKATISSGGNKRTGASVDDQFEPPAKLFRASADLGAERSHGISSSSPVLSELPLPSTWAFALDSEEGNPKGNQREPLGPKAKFGITMDYEENIYTTTIDKSHPDYKQRHKVAERKAREIERSVAAKLHVAEERTTDNLGEEDKYIHISIWYCFLVDINIGTLVLEDNTLRHLL
jgi:serine/threonine protein kinase